MDWLSANEQHVWRAYLLATTSLNEKLDRDLRHQFDLSLMEYEILVRLSEAPKRSLRMAELADQVKNSRSRTTHTIARMEADGLVERRACVEDGRGVSAHVTRQGLRLLAKAAPLHVQGVREALIDQVDPADFDALGRAFVAVASHLDPDSISWIPDRD